MSNYPQSFITFAIQRMESHGDEIKLWAKSDNPLLSRTCREIIEAAGEGVAMTEKENQFAEGIKG